MFDQYLDIKLCYMYDVYLFFLLFMVSLTIVFNIAEQFILDRLSLYNTTHIHVHKYTLTKNICYIPFSTWNEQPEAYIGTNICVYILLY